MHRPQHRQPAPAHAALPAHDRECPPSRRLGQQLRSELLGGRAGRHVAGRDHLAVLRPAHHADLDLMPAVAVAHHRPIGLDDERARGGTQRLRRLPRRLHPGAGGGIRIGARRSHGRGVLPQRIGMHHQPGEVGEHGRRGARGRGDGQPHHPRRQGGADARGRGHGERGIDRAEALPTAGAVIPGARDGERTAGRADGAGAARLHADGLGTPWTAPLHRGDGGVEVGRRQLDHRPQQARQRRLHRLTHRRFDGGERTGALRLRLLHERRAQGGQLCKSVDGKGLTHRDLPPGRSTCLRRRPFWRARPPYHRWTIHSPPMYRNPPHPRRSGAP
jgi:hypothetical protein